MNHEPTSRRAGRSDRAEDATGRRRRYRSALAATPPENAPLLDLDIGPVATGGACVARYDGRVVFVRHTLPGERVRARVTEQRPGFWRADAVEVIEAAPERVSAPCGYAGPGGCGGCDWQHVQPHTQRRHKAELVAGQLKQLAGLDLPVTVEELPGGPLGWRSRTRFASARAGRLGLHRHRSRDVVALEDCLLLTEPARTVGLLSTRWPGAAAVEVVASASGGGRAVVVSPHARRRVDVPQLPSDVAVLQHQARTRLRSVHGSAAVIEVVDGRPYRVSGSSFWQGHPAAAQEFVAAVLDRLSPLAGRTALDLYSGVGLFAAALAARGATVEAVESDPVAVADAERNCAGQQVTVRRGRVEDLLAGCEPADVAVLDPPRAGAGATVCALLAQRVRDRIVYLSCDPATLARDLAYLSEEGWVTTRVNGYDAFPMTAHVECLAVLERR